MPTRTVRCFACTSDRDEFHELVYDMPVTSTWFMTPGPSFFARLYIAIAQPAKNLSLDNTAKDIAALSVTNLVSSSQ